MYEIERLPQSIDIGYTGEMDFRTVQIDMSEWVAKMPEGQPTLMHLRPGEYDPYPVTITYENNIITWSVTDGDLGTSEGTGLLQVWFGVQDETEVMRQLGMSAVVPTIIHLSLAGEGRNSSTVQIPWLKEVMEMKNLILGYDYEAESWANGQRGGEDVGSDDPAYHNNAKYYKEQVEDMASDSEAFAAGTRGGEAVDEDDPAYHNNANYYNSQAALEKAAAQAAAETASAAYNVNLLAANYDATKTYAVGEYVIYSGGLYRCISAITTAEAWTAAHWSSVTVGKDTSALKSAIDYCNAFSCIPFKKDTYSIRDVSYSISPDGITVSGFTGASGAGYKLFESASRLPDGLEVGKTYLINYESENVNLVIYSWDGANISELLRTKTSMKWTVPATLTPGCSIRLLVSPNTAQFTENIDYPMILNTKTNGMIVDETMMPEGILPNATDINDVKKPGVYFINGETGYGYDHSPLPQYVAGTLEVFTSKKIIVQRVTRYSNGDQYIRTSNSSGSFSNRDWNHITNTYNNTYTTQSYENSYTINCSPEITTDTNNYLASTGDTTDRTGDIQTMLNTTGVCRLGPGDFYVTGVEIPNMGCLSGSGDKTRIVLASSVENGYAVKMLNRGTIKNLRIAGQLSGSPSSSTIGTRHGILYQGTATSSVDASSARRFYGYISDVFIESFSGGAITCVSTGGQVNSNLVVCNVHIRSCGAGINVALYSEFHRFTNVSATDCYYGCICNGGNCNFVNCSFSYCRIGILMDDGTGQSPNNSHGTFSACTVCHSGTNNDGIAIKLLGLDSGEIFVGMQIFYGSVVIDNCKGIRIIGGNFGNSTPLTVTNSTAVVFSDCQMTSASASALTQSDNTTLKFNECYNKDGSVFNPLAS